MGAEFNVNQALDQAKNFIKERLDKKSVKQATSIVQLPTVKTVGLTTLNCSQSLTE